MANSLGATNGTLIARRALDTLLEEFPLLRQITADFSDEQTLLNQPLKIKIPDAMTAGDYTSANGYVSQDVSQQDISLTIDNHVHVTYGFDDTERSSTDIMLVERFARNAAHAIGKRFMDDLLALVVAANFTNYSVYTEAAFSPDNLADVRTKMNGRKIPSGGRFAVINSGYYESLAKSATLIANAGSPAGTVRTGDVGNVHGFDISEYAFLDDNNENLSGFCGVAEGLVIAVRVPTLPDQKALAGGTVETVTEPNTKLSIQVRSWYDFQKGKEFRTYTLMYGVAKGNTACIERLLTQEPA